MKTNTEYQWNLTINVHQLLLYQSRISNQVFSFTVVWPQVASDTSKRALCIKIIKTQMGGMIEFKYVNVISVANWRWKWLLFSSFSSWWNLLRESRFSLHTFFFPPFLSLNLKRGKERGKNWRERIWGRLPKTDT